jgi:hypothetical protein
MSPPSTIQHTKNIIEKNTERNTMKYRYLLLAAFMTLNSAWAQTSPLAERQNALSEAMIKADANALKQLTATELSYGHSSGRVEDQTSFIANLVSGASDFVSIELQNQQIQPLDDLAVVRHTLVAKTNDSGKPGQVRIGVMLVWQLQGESKKDKEWVLLARQAFKL